MLDKFEKRGVHVIFMGTWVRLALLTPESLCDQEDIITANIRSVKLSSPDVSTEYGGG